MLAFFTVITLFPTDNDAVEYQNIMRKASAKSRQEPKKEPFMATQHRIGVRKDIFYQEGESRLQMRVDSDKSDLVYDHQGDKTEIIEKLTNLRCYMQEELYYLLPDNREVVSTKDGRYKLRNTNPDNESPWVDVDQLTMQPMQAVRYIEADTAAYRMTSDSLIAEQAEIFQYKLPGHSLDNWTLPEKPCMKGVANKIEVKVKSSGLDIKASGLKGKILFKIGGRSG